MEFKELTDLEFLEEIKDFVFKLNIDKINEGFFDKKSKKVSKRHSKNIKKINKLFVKKYKYKRQCKK